MNQPTPSMSADPIVALADSGTPGPWRAEPDTAAGRVWVQAGRHNHESDLEPLFSVRTANDYATRAADARKIVAAVNALPKVAALVAAIDALPKFDPPPPQYHDPACDGTGCGCWLVTLVDTLLTARDALVAALGVDQ